MNTAILSTNFDALTLDQLDTASGGSFWSGVKHIAGNVERSAKVAVQDMVNGAAAGAAGGGVIGGIAGSWTGPGMAATAGVGAAVGGAAGGFLGLGYGAAHEISKYVK